MSDDQRGSWTSASSAPYDALCPARHLRQRGIPEPASSTPDADSGSRVHAWLAGKDVKLTREERDVAEACAEIEIEAIAKLLGVQTNIAQLRNEP